MISKPSPDVPIDKYRPEDEFKVKEKPSSELLLVIGAGCSTTPIEFKVHKNADDNSSKHPIDSVVEFNPNAPSSVISSSILPTHFEIKTASRLTDSDYSSAEFYDTEKDWVLFARELDDKAIRASKGDQSMPCMIETSNIIITQLDKYLAADWLDNSEKEAISSYKEQVLSLKNSGYPYKKSLMLALEFTLIQDLYNFLSLDYIPENEAEEINKSSVSELKSRWCFHSVLFGWNRTIHSMHSTENDFGPLTLANLIHQDWNTVFFGLSSEQQDKFNNVPTSAIERETDAVKKALVLNTQAEEYQYNQTKAVLTLKMMLPSISGRDFTGLIEALLTASVKKLFVPSFNDMTIKTMNLTQNTALVPIGLTTKRVELHDGLQMSSAVLAFHDILHESLIKSGVMNGDIKRKLSHNMIVSFYKNQRKVDECIHFFTEIMIFDLGHESGYEFSELLINGKQLYDKLEMFKTLLYRLPSNLLPPSFRLNDGKYKNTELESLRWLQAHIESTFVSCSHESSVSAIYDRLQKEAHKSVFEKHRNNYKK